MNKVYKIVWNQNIKQWVVASELAKGMQKSASSVGHVGQHTPTFFKKGFICIALLSVLSGAGAQSITVNTAAEFKTAVEGGAYDHITLGSNITLTQDIAVNFSQKNNIVIDGNHQYELKVTNPTNYGLSINKGGGTLTLQNMSIDTANYYSMVRVDSTDPNINIVYDNIKNFSASQHTFMRGGGGNSNAIATMGNMGVVAPVTRQEIGEINKMIFTGQYHVVHSNSWISFQNSSAVINTATMDFKKGADVKIDRTGTTANITNTDNRAFAYTFEDGAKFELIAAQNILLGTNTNRGFRIGTYGDAGFGAGASIILNQTNTGAAYANGIDNATTNTTGINHNAKGTDHVVFNLGDETDLRVMGTGISASKTTGSGSIYVRNAGEIDANIGMHIEHNNGTDGEVVLANQGTILSKKAGIELLSTANKNMQLDGTSGSITASSGVGIKVGNASANGNLNLALVGGEINVSEGAAGIEFNGNTANTHTITGTTINANGTTSTAIKHNNANAHIMFKDTHINIEDGIGFSNLNNKTFAKGDAGETNQITVKGKGTALRLAKDLSQLAGAHLNINVTDHTGVVGTTGTGVGVEITGGTVADVIKVEDGVNINATGATALKILGTVERELVNQGVITGYIRFDNGDVNNTITNTGTMDQLITHNGDDTLTIETGASLLGVANLGDGQNKVYINNPSQIHGVMTGSGDDLFELSNIDSNHHTVIINQLDAGAGTNTLNVKDSIFKAQADTKFENFANIHLDKTALTLVASNNIATGTVHIDQSSALTLGDQYTGDFSASVVGDGTVTIDKGATVTLTGTNTGLTGNLTVAAGGTLNTNHLNQFGSGTTEVAGTLNHTANSLQTHLTGAGQLNLTGDQSAFNFDDNVGSDFTGNVRLQNNTFNLSGTNTKTLANSTLSLSSGNTTTVEGQNQAVKNLELDGATLVFKDVGSIVTNHLSNTIQDSVIQVDVTDTESVNVIDQNSGVGKQLITAKTTAINLDHVALQDLAGQAMGAGTELEIKQNGHAVADGTYHYALKENQGLVLNYGLSKINIHDDQTLQLDAKTATSKVMNAQITGLGGIDVTSDAKGLTIENASNDYKGVTTVTEGLIIVGSDNAFGQTSSLNLAAAATVNLNGKTQTVGGLTNAGSLDIAGGQFTLKGNGSSNTADGLRGAGQLTIDGGDLSVFAENKNLSANVAVTSGATLTLMKDATLGSSQIAIAGDLKLNGVASAVENILSGAGTVHIGNNAAVNFSGNNAGFTGTFAIDGTSQLTATHFSQLGSGKVTIAESGNVHFNNIQSELTNAISGAGNLNLAGTDLSLNTGNVKLKDLTGSITLTNASSLTLVETGQLNDTAKVNIAVKGDSITVNSKDDFSLNNHLIGTGLLDVKADGNSFNFGRAVGNEFAGTVNLENSTFDLKGNNTNALTNATLVVGTGNITTVDTADQTIGNLTLQGGQTVFNGKGSINTNTLASNGASTIKVDLNAITPTDGSAANLLDQNKGQHTQLITAKDNSGLKISDLTLQKLDGSKIGTGTIRDVNQNGQTVAKGTYNYALNKTGGLGVNYGLSALEIADGQTLALDATNATNKNMTAIINGKGNLTLTSDATGLILTNDKNAYTGATNVTAGLVTVGSDNAFGHTSSLNLAAKTTVNLNGKAQTVGSLTNAGSVDLAGGSLTVTNAKGASSTSTGILKGNGDLSISAGDLSITKANTDLNANIAIDSGAAISLSDAGTLGSSQIALEGDLNLNANTSLGNVLTGKGAVNTKADVTLTGDNSGFTGTFAIDGTSQLTATNFNQLGKGSVQVAQDGAVHLNNITSELTNAISGVGNLNLAGTDLSLNTSNVKLKDLRGSINLTNASSLTLVETGQLNDAAKVNIAAKGDRITVNSKDDFSLNNHLTGTGLLDVKVNDNSFNFGNAVGKEFAGTVNLENSIFTLGGSNTDALTNATLVVGNGNITTVDTADQTIGNLTLQGGQTVFNGKGLINTNTLVNNGESTITVDLNAITPTDGSSANLLDQNKGQHTQLITAKNNSGLTISDLTLQKLDGSEIGTGTIRDVNQNGQTVAKGTYNYALNNTDGLGVNYGLSALEIADGQTLALDATNATNKNMTAAINGKGTLTLTSDATGLILTNDKNAYTGATTITAGLVTAGSDNAFGHTSSLNLAAKTTVNLNGKTQTVGSLTNAGSVDLAGGSLTLMNGGQSTSDNGLLGAGKVTVTAGNLSIVGKNDALTADVAVNSGAAISLSGAGTLGSSQIALEGDLNLNADTSLGNNLAGNGSVNTKADVTLTGDNAGFTGTQNIGNNASVTIANQAALGSGQVSFAAKSSQLNLNGITSAVQNVLSGAGIINISEKSAIDFSADNQGFDGTFVVDGASSLTTTDFSQLGKGSVSVVQGGAVNLDKITGELTNIISGDGNLNLSGTNLSLNSGNIHLKDLTGAINITKNSNLTLAENGQLNDAAKVNITAVGDSVTVNSNSDFSFNNNLVGSGLLNVQIAGNSFNFGKDVGSDFAGTVNLSNSAFNLSSDNTTALKNATLVIGQGNTTTVDTENQAIGNLTLEGGRTVFKGEGSIATGILANNGSSIIQVDLDAIAPTDATAANLFDQNSGQSKQLITAKNNDGLKLSDLMLQELNGSTVGTGTIRNIDQNDQKVAEGTYNYALNKTGGLGISYGLSALNIVDGQTLTLDATSAANKNMTATLTGAGNLVLISDDKGLTLTNEKNAYTGATNVTAGLVTAGSNNAFGQTSQLNLAAGTTVDLNSKTQTIGILTNEGKVDFAGGTLTITNANGAASTSSGELLGTGSLIISAGDLSITSVNNDLAAEVAIKSGASVTLDDAGTLGTSTAAVDGALNLNASSTLANQLKGIGTVNTKADVTLTGDNAGFTGTQNIGNNASVTVVNQAALGLGKVNFVAESSKLNLNGVTSAVKNVLHGAGSVNIGNNAAVNFSGNNAGFTGTFAIDGTSQLTANNFSQLGSGKVIVAESGNVHFNNIQSELTNAISGAGNLNLAGTDLSLNTGNVKLKDLRGAINLTNASSLTLVETGQLNDAAKVNIAAKGDRITVNSKDDFSLNNHLTGTGLLDVKADGNSFNFGNAVGNEFAGTVNLENSTFDLKGNNTSALTNATLVVGTGNITTVDTADQTIGNLTLQGGQTVFNGKGSINTHTLVNNGESTITVDLNAITPTDGSAANLLDQNKGQHTQLITAKDNGGLKISDLTLQKLDGSEIGIGTIRDVNQNGQTVAKGTYNYALNNTDGLGVNYGLSALEIVDGQTLVLDVTNATNKEMTAAITGSGDLTLTSDDKGLTLTNDKNAYTGATTITAGLVTAGSDNAFGHTSSLNLAAKTTVNLNGKTQTVGSLTNAGSVDLAGGSLTVTNANGASSTSTGILKGIGYLTISAGDLSITKANTDLNANIAVNSGAAISLSGAGTLGTSQIALEGDLNLNANTSLGNNLAGNGSVNTKADVTLTGDNSGFTGTQNIGNNASVTVANQAALGFGKVNFVAESSKLNLNGVTSAVKNVLHGAGSVNIGNNAAVNFSGNNAGFTGTFAIDGTSQLTTTNFNQLGKGSVQVAQDGTVHLNNITSELTNAISGAGNLNLAGSHITVSPENTNLANFTGAISLLESAEKGGSVLTLNSKDHLAVNNALKGTGTLNVNATNSSNTVSFGNAVGNEFAGTVNLENSIFTLGGSNTDALTNATLVVGNGNITTVDTADQTIGNLTLQGGQTVFNGKGSINTNTLASNGASTIKVDLNAIAPTSDNAANLLDQNKGQHIQLITAKNNGDLKINELTLQKLDGSDIGAGTIRSIDQNGQTVAKGTYNYALNKTGGLGVNYGLSALEIADGQTLALDATNATNKNMTAIINGKGNLTLTSDATGLILTNDKNAYTGATNVTAGLVTAGSDNAFGQTSNLNLAAKTTVNLNGKAQTVGSLTNAGSMDLAGGSLTLMNGGQSTSDNGLLGAGKVTVTAGNLSIVGKNDALTADVAINSGAAISLSGAGTLGTSQIALEGDLNLNSSTTFSNQLAGKGTVNTKADVTLTGDNSGFAGVFNINDKTLSVTSEKQLGTASIVNHGALDIRLLVDGQLVNTMTGTGDFIKSGHGTLSVTNELLHTGQTHIHEGTLFLEKGAVLGGAQSVGSVHIAKDATLAGSGTINQRVYNDGTIDVNLNGVRQGRASAGGNAKLTINQDVYNNNKIYIGSHHTAAGNQLIINGNYIAGENAVLYMNTDLGNSSTSVVDQLIVSGDASGKTQLHITDLGNVAGGMTSPLGVKIIETGTSDAQAFALQNAVIKGIYEYELKQNENDQDWYLTSYRELYRPDVGSAMANSMGTMRAQLPGYGAHTSGALAAGSGGLRALNRNMTADGQYLGSVWFNETGTHDEGDIAGNQIHYSYKGFASVLGADTGFRTGDGLVIIGGMISTSSMDSKGWNRINESRSTGSIKGHAFGVYGSWFKNADDTLSPFIDYTISYGRYDNTVKTLNNASSAYDSRLWTVSVQGGYPMAVGENLVIEPQAQISYIDYKVDSYRDFNGTQITEKQNGHVISRVGAYIYPKTGDVKPYAAMNLWYDDVSSKVSYDDRSLSSGKPGLFYEAKLGVQAKMSDHFTINAEANYRQGKHKHKNYNFNVGFKYQF